MQTSYDKLGRSTVYDWKKADPTFSIAWDSAVQTSYDELEGRLYRIAMSADDAVSCLTRAHATGEPVIIPSCA